MQRKTTDRAWVFCIAVIGPACISASLLAKRPEQNGSTMDLTDKRVAEKFDTFENEQEPALLQEALETIEAAEQDAPAGDEVARKRGIARWLLFFATLDRNIDPQWDPEEVPVTGVIPPPSYGVVYSPGVDPSVIADPAARAKYEQALKAIKDYAEWYRVQLLLRRIDERAMDAAGRRLSEIYTDSLADRQEFEVLLAASAINDARKEQLRAFIHQLD